MNAETPDSRPHGHMLMLAAALLNAAAAANYSALSVTLPTIAADLGIGEPQETWLPDAFLIAVVCVTPLTPRLVAGLGQRRLIAVAAWGTVAASLMTAATQRFDLLVALLFVQGLLAAPLPPATHSLITNVVPFAHQSRGMAAWTAGTMGGFLAGAVIGGKIAQHLGWRWIPLIGIPFALAGLAAARAALAERADDAGAPHHKTDWLGASLLVVTLLSAAVALDLGAELDPAHRPTILWLAAGSLAGAIAFAANYRRIETPILDLLVARDRPLAVASTLNLVATATSTGIFITVMLGSVAGIGAEEMGLLAALRGGALLLGVAAAPFLLGSTERYRLVAILGLLVLCAGKLGMLGWDADTGFVQAAIPGALTSIGIGLISTALAVMAIATVSRDKTDAASSLFVFSGVLGSAIGVAVLGALRAWREATLAAAGAVTPELTSFRELFGMNLLIAILLLPLPLLATRGRAGNYSASDRPEEP